MRVGTSGWRYRGWRGDFYPTGLPQRLELAYLAERVNSIELNGSFYSLQRPASYLTWAQQVPDDFVFSVKGSRFITHMKRLRDVDAALANFFASGVLALEGKLGPILWQLPPGLAFDRESLDSFLGLLPRSSSAAARLASNHDSRLAGRSWTTVDEDRPIRHVIEPRHPSFAAAEFTDLLRRHECGLVIADTANRFPLFDEVTTDIVYVRLHGSEELYTSRYGDEALDRWAERLHGWEEAGLPGYVYFDNDANGHAPHDAVRLLQRLGTSAPSR